MKMQNKAQMNILGKMKSRDSKLQMRWDHKKNVPAMIKGKLAEPISGPVEKLAAAAALDFLDDNKQLFFMSEPKKELSATKKTTDARGNRCVALQQNHKGIPVEGATVRVHLSKDNSVYEITNKFEPGIDLEDIKPAISSAKAYEKAIKDNKGSTRVEAVAPKLVIFTKQDKPRLAWVVEVGGEDGKRPMRYFIDAKDGKVLRKFSTLHFGSGTGIYSGSGSLNSISQNGTYRLTDNTRAASGGPTLHTCDMNNALYYAATPDSTNISEDDNDNWDDNTTSPRYDNQRTEVDIHRYIAEVVDYYRNTHGWNGINNTGGDIYSGAHVRFPTPNNAAYWSATDCFYFGDGDNNTFGYLSALDIAAHEFTHGVTNHTSNLDYDDEAGGLNEAFSDIFAAFVDSADTLIGEDCTTPAIPGDCLRNMDDPSSTNALSRIPNHVLPAYDTMGIGYYNGQDPHEACGPVIYAAALLLVGGTHPNSNITVQSIGYAKCEQIFWHIQSNGLLGNSNATFLECREAAVDAVDALFSGDINYLQIMNSVKNAFTAVGIGPDIYIRDNIADDGTIPNAAPLYRSPDIIVRQNQELSPGIAFADLTNDSLGENVEAGQDNWIYLRLQNRGSVQGDVTVSVYWSAPNLFAFPAQWNLIDTINVNAVQPGGLSIGEVQWRQQDLPSLGHFCLIAELDSTVDPAPNKTLITNGSLFSKFIAESNNFAWKNINVVDILPSSLTNLEFMVSGDDSNVLPEIHIDLTDLPNNADVYMRILRRLCEGSDVIGMSYREANSRYNYYNIAPGRVGKIRDVAFGNIDTSELHVYVGIPGKTTKNYSVVVTQLIGGRVTGRITHVLNMMSEDDFEFIGNANTREVHKKGCRWVGKMSAKNKRGFRSLSNAHNVGYDNCAYCIGGSKR